MMDGFVFWILSQGWILLLIGPAASWDGGRTDRPGDSVSQERLFVPGGLPRNLPDLRLHPRPLGEAGLQVQEVQQLIQKGIATFHDDPCTLCVSRQISGFLFSRATPQAGASGHLPENRVFGCSNRVFEFFKSSF